MRPLNIVRGRRSQSLPTARCKRSSVRWWETNRNTWPRTLSVQMSRGLKQALAELVNGTGPLPFRQLRQSARNFTGTELEKELIVYRHIQHWMPEVDLLLSTLSLSQKNLQHLAEKSRLLRCQTETSNRRQPMAVFIVLSSNAMAASAGTYCRWLCASCQTDQTEGKGLCAGSGV